MSRDLESAVGKAASLIIGSKYVVALVGAGISVESGIPPFRGPGGLWTKYGEPDMRDYERFLEDPKAWWVERLKPPRHMADFRARIYDSKPNPAHYALAEMEEIGVLRSVVTQNVDNLHRIAGSRNVVEIHGNVTKLRCISCGRRFPREGFSLEELPPRCPVCQGIVKMDTVMFGEPIPPDVLQSSRAEALRCDCMLLIGTSGVVYPAAGLALIAKRRSAALIEVNPNKTELSDIVDIALRGTAGEILPQIVNRVKRLQGGRQS